MLVFSVLMEAEAGDSKFKLTLGQLKSANPSQNLKKE